MFNARLAELALVLLSCAVAAQTPELSRIIVRIMDPTGTPIPGAEIWVDQLRSENKKPFTSDSNGTISLDLPVGTHSLQIHSPGFSQWASKVTVEKGENLPISAKLRIGTYSGPIVSQLPEMPVCHSQPGYIELQALWLLPLSAGSVRKGHQHNTPQLSP